MPNVGVFISFEFDKDGDIKNNFLQQAKTLSPHRVINCSLNETYPDQQWKDRARSAIRQCDVVIVLVGPDTHNALGVKIEVDIARQLGKSVFQILPQGRPYRGVPYLDTPVRWRWSRINAKIDELLAGNAQG